jgi:DNA-binding winged helix-turn-helix (wHTH) protein
MSASPIDTTPNPLDAQDGASLAPDLTEPFTLGDWRVEPAFRRICRGEIVVKVDPRNMRVLQILAERQGKLVSSREIEAAAWEGVVVTPDSLYQSIRQLRQALRDTKSPAKYIETVPRRGYRLVAEVVAARGSAASSIALADPPDLTKQAPAAGVGSAATQSTFAGGIPKRIYVPGAAALILCLVAGTLGYLRFTLPLQAMATEPLGDHPNPKAQEYVSVPLNSRPEKTHKLDAQALRDLGRIARDSGRPREALSYFQQALGKQLTNTGERNEIVASLLTDLANIYFWLDDDVAAHSAARRAEVILDRLTPASSPDRIDIFRILGEVLTGLGDYEAAERLLSDSCSLSRKYFGDGRPLTACTGAQSILRHAQGRLEEAEQMAREALESTIRLRGLQDFRTAQWRTVLGLILVDRGRFAEGEREARMALDTLVLVVDERHPYKLSSMQLLAEALSKQGEHLEAESLLREELTVLENDRATDWRVARAASALGEVLLFQGQVTEAKGYLTLAQQKLTRSKGWPIEREQRNLKARLEEFSLLQSKSTVAKL